jgi:hypothetical protein
LPCKTSDWSICDPVTKMQSRSIVQQQSGNGAACSALTQSCVPDLPCKTSDWSICDPVTKMQSRSIVQQQSGNGAACSALTQSCVPNQDCVQSDWSICDPTTWLQSRTTITQPSGTGAVCGPSTKVCALSPKLLRDTLQWQYNCTDCGGLVWQSVGSGPWNRYYKISCQNGDAESQLTPAYGPVGNNNYNNPMLRISNDWKNDTCNGYTTNIYRSKTLAGPYTKLDRTKLIQSWSATPQWDDKAQGRFNDFDTSNMY